MQLPSYIANQVLFVAVALVNEQLRTTIYIDTDNKTVQGNAESGYWTKILISFLVLNLFFVLIQAKINYQMFKMMGMRYL